MVIKTQTQFSQRLLFIICSVSKWFIRNWDYLLDSLSYLVTAALPYSFLTEFSYLYVKCGFLHLGIAALLSNTDNATMTQRCYSRNSWSKSPLREYEVIVKYRCSICEVELVGRKKKRKNVPSINSRGSWSRTDGLLWFWIFMIF